MGIGVWRKECRIGYMKKKMLEIFGKLWKGEVISREIKRALYERRVIPTVVYGPETWTLSVQEKRKYEVFEIMYLRNIYGIRRSERMINSLIKQRRNCKFSVVKKVERSVKMV